MTPTIVQAGSAANTVPGSGSFAVDVRARTVTEQQRVDRAMQSLRPALPWATLDIDGGPNRPPMEASSSAGLYARICALAARLDMPEPRSVAVGGASDGNFTAGVGTPTLDGLGAIGGGAHADDEHVVIDELPGRTHLLTAFVRDLVGGEARSDHAHA